MNDGRSTVMRLARANVAICTILLLLSLLLSSKTPPSAASGYADMSLISLSSVVYTILGALILARKSTHRAGIVLAVAGLDLAATNFLGKYVTFGLLVNPQSLPLAEEFTVLLETSGSIITACLPLLLLVFPDGQFLSIRWQRLWQAVILTTMLMFVYIVVLVWPLRGRELSFGQYALVLENSLLFTVYQSVWLVALLAAAGSLLLRWRRADLVDRQRIKWLLFGVAIMLAAIAAGVALTLLPGGLSDLSGFVIIHIVFLAVPVSIGIAILRHGLWDIDLIIRKTLIYAFLTGILVAIYFVAVVVAQQLLGTVTGEASDLAIVVSTLIIAALFNPLRRRSQQTIDQRFYRRKYDAEQTLARFNQTLRDEVDIETLQTQLLAVVQETMQPNQVALWLRSESINAKHS